MKFKMSRRVFAAQCCVGGGALYAARGSAERVVAEGTPVVIPAAAYQRRLSLVQQDLSKKDIGALVIFSAQAYDTRYISGHAPGVLLVPTDRAATLFATGTPATWIQDVQSGADPEQLLTKCGQRLKELGLEKSRIAVGGEYSWAVKSKLGSELPSARFEAGNEVQDQFRLIKDEYEIASMRLSQMVADAEIRAGMTAIKPGRRDWDVLADMIQAGVQRGAAIDNCRHFIGYGPGTDDLWSPPSGRRIKSGEVVNFEGIIYHGHYNLETPVTFAVGKVSNRQKEIAAINFEAFQAGMAEIKPGAPVGASVAASNKVLESHGFDKMIRRHGHFIGLANNDRPTLDEAIKAELTLQPGMTISYHTTVVAPDRAAIAIVGSVALVTKAGKELLTAIEPKPMIETV